MKRENKYALPLSQVNASNEYITMTTSEPKFLQIQIEFNNEDDGDSDNNTTKFPSDKTDHIRKSMESAS